MVIAVIMAALCLWLQMIALSVRISLTTSKLPNSEKDENSSKIKILCEKHGLEDGFMMYLLNNTEFWHETLDGAVHRSN